MKVSGAPPTHGDTPKLPMLRDAAGAKLLQGAAVDVSASWGAGAAHVELVLERRLRVLRGLLGE